MLGFMLELTAKLSNFGHMLNHKVTALHTNQLATNSFCFMREFQYLPMISELRERSFRERSFSDLRSRTSGGGS